MTPNQKLRYAVVGQGYFAQVAVLPAFAHAQENSELVALVSDTPKKLARLAKKYDVAHTLAYDELDDFLKNKGADAIYLAVPNSLHRDFTLRAARAGANVLCEKPMALDEAQCEEMIRACREAGVKLMIAYRLHFEPANLEAIEVIRSGRIGQPRVFNSVFSYQVEEGNIRTRGDLGGGPLYDIGIYCINAARYLFQAEPTQVVAMMPSSDDPRFRDVEEAVSATLRFPDERLASFVVSFGAFETSRYEVLGTQGRLVVEPAYEFAGKLARQLTIGKKTEKKTYPKHDQVAPELVYFSQCVLENREPEPSGVEGLADVRIIKAIKQAAETGRAVDLGGFEKRRRPSAEQEITKPAGGEPELVDAEPPHD